MSKAVTPLRSSSERLKFCEAYFTSVGAEMTVQSEMYREYVLPRDVDKELTDRPFYWLWVEKTNQEVTPTTLRLAFSVEAQTREDLRLEIEHEKLLEANPSTNPHQRMFSRPQKTELMNLGSFRFDKILSSVEQRGKFACVVPREIKAGQPLVPWLMLCGTIAYTSDSLQEERFSVGVCLENRQVVFNFYDKVNRIPMVQQPISIVTKRATIEAGDAIDLSKKTLMDYVKRQNHDWADTAQLRLEDDLSQLDAYYYSIMRESDEPSAEHLQQEHARKREDLISKSMPRVDISLRQMAFIGLPLRTSNLS